MPAPEVTGVASISPPDGVLLLATVEGDPVAIGGVRDLGGPQAEIKSMYVDPAARGRGIGRRLLARLEEVAAERGCEAARLDTLANLGPACTLYESAGYERVADYNGSPHADRWYERRLDRQAVPGANSATLPTLEERGVAAEGRDAAISEATLAGRGRPRRPSFVREASGTSRLFRGDATNTASALAFFSERAVPAPAFPRKTPRPGRLVAASARPGRHETAGTAGSSPGARPEPSPGARNRLPKRPRAGRRLRAAGAGRV